MAKLSICVPSRNRQFYFQQTIRALLESPRSDVEFVFADNSDDASIMADFMTEFADDPRVVFLASKSCVLSMLDNWERTVAAATGDWVTVIGDDDYADPELAALLTRMDAAHAGIEAVDWRKLDYFWPAEGVARSHIKIEPNSDFVIIPRTRLFERYFLWEGATCVPSVGYSIYHSAVSRPLLERIRQRFGGTYFEHPTVDYDSATKVILEGRHFAYTSRPFSVHGRSPLSCSGLMMAGLQQLRRKNVEFMQELGRDIRDEVDADAPFDYRLGVTGSILQTVRWILRRYGIVIDGWQENFVRACAENCYLYVDSEQFHQLADSYRSAISNWEGGRYLAFFNPLYSPKFEGEPFTGVNGSIVYVLDDVRIFETPSELYGIASAMFEAPDDMVLATDHSGLSAVALALRQALLDPPAPANGTATGLCA